uniref:tRNA selenocysteine 1-associated protein 1 n=1 Tax=Leptobrachium leishanense TaxID=445787 RepID=A0A8C5PWY0_9ANUR
PLGQGVLRTLTLAPLCPRRQLAGYCFVEFPDRASAEKCLQRLNGKHVPGTSFAKRFKLKHALYGKPPEPGKSSSEQPISNSDVAQQQVSEYVQAFNYYSQQFQQVLSSNKSAGYTYQPYGYTQDSWQGYDDAAEEEEEEDSSEDPAPKEDLREADRHFMEQSEELYDALMDCHWQPLDSLTSKIPTGEYVETR